MNKIDNKYDKIRFGIDLEKSRDNIGMNRNQLAAEIGLSSNAIKKWETGHSFPQSDKWKAIKDATGINPQDYKKYDSGVLSQNPDQVVTKDTTPHIAEPANFSRANDPRPPQSIPIISWVQAGEWQTVVDIFQPGDADDWISTSATSSPSAFALTVRGDSMEPEFAEGDTITVDPDRVAENGNYVIAKNGEEATFKQIVFDGTSRYLKPLNSRYPIKDMTGINFRIVGVVVEKRKRY